MDKLHTVEVVLVITEEKGKTDFILKESSCIETVGLKLKFFYE